MEIIESTGLWRRTLSEENWSEKAPGSLGREFASRLRESFKLFRKRVSILTSQIESSFRDLCVHDITHNDALWPCADLLLGDDYPLNPVESYVLGGAFLLHDAGLALASYPDSQEELERDLLWQDCAAQVFRRTEGRTITEQEMANLDTEVRQEANELFLRLRHAKRAETLGIVGYRASSGDAEYFLIDDADLRDAFGHIVGRIAYSHWWSPEQVREKFSRPFGACPGSPADWTVDPLKIAFILRASDAIQIDATRAPALLRALRKPVGISDCHWRFQHRMQTPCLENGRVVFTSTRPFLLDDADAWWVGLDLLRLANRELHAVDDILRESGRERFRANQVQGVDDPKKLARTVEVQGWLPVHTAIHVSDVRQLVETLGGRGLYGNRAYVPLRELIQNARDAVHARRLEEGRDEDWGDIRVELESRDGVTFLTVSDTGIGMSENVLSSALLDFGQSYWDSQDMIYDHPGLAAKGFQPTGRYGIGFFSVFMLGDSVRVISRRPEDRQSECRVLEFAGGLKGQIFLRDANDDETLLEPGTKVVVVLRDDPAVPGGLLGPCAIGTRSVIPDGRYQKGEPWRLCDLCGWIAPALDVDLVVIHEQECVTAVRANDWLSLPAHDLLQRLLLYRDDVSVLSESDVFRRIADNVEPIRNSSGEVIGRAALTDHLTVRMKGAAESIRAPSAITAGGFRADESLGISGLLIGTSTGPSRITSEPLAYKDRLALSGWASSQSRKVGALSRDLLVLQRYAQLIRFFGGDTGDLPVFRDCDGFKSFNEIAGSSKLADEIELIQDMWGEEHGGSVVLTERQLGVSSGKFKSVFDFKAGKDPKKRADHPRWDQYWMSLWGAAIEAVARSWNVRLQDVLEASEFRAGLDKPQLDENGRQVFRITSDVLRAPIGKRR